MTVRAKRVLLVGILALLFGLGFVLRPDGPLGHKVWPAEAIEPHVSASGNQVALAFMEVAGSGEVATAIAVRGSHDGGQTLGDVEQLIAPGHRLSADPTLAFAPDGSLYVSWLSFRSHSSIESEPFDMAIVVAQRRPGQAHFDPPMLVARDPQTTYDKPWSSVDRDGIFHVVFRSAFANRAGIHEVALAADGRLSTRKLIDEPGFSGSLPTVCSDPVSSQSYVAYLRPERGIELLSFDKNTVVPPQLVSNDGERIANAGPSCVATPSSVVVAYGLCDSPWDSARSPQPKALVLVQYRGPGIKNVRKEIGQPGLIMMYPQLLPSLVGQDSQLQLAFLAGHRDGDPDATLRLLSLPVDLSQDVPPRVDTLRRGLRMTASREDRRWPGDYLGIARSDGHTVISYVDNSGRRHARLAILP